MPARRTIRKSWEDSLERNTSLSSLADIFEMGASAIGRPFGPSSALPRRPAPDIIAKDDFRTTERELLLPGDLRQPLSTLANSSLLATTYLLAS